MIITYRPDSNQCIDKNQEREKYKLADPKSFHYLNQSSCFELDGVNDAHEYLATRRAMDVVGISEEEQVNFQYFLVQLWCLMLHQNFDNK